jgi:hypothetical protein
MTSDHRVFEPCRVHACYSRTYKSYARRIKSGLPLVCHFYGPKIDLLTVLTISESFRFVLITKSVKVTRNTAPRLRSERGFKKKGAQPRTLVHKHGTASPQKFDRRRTQQMVRG